MGCRREYISQVPVFKWICGAKKVRNRDAQKNRDDKYRGYRGI